MGIPNYGYKYYLDYGITCNKPYFQSLTSFNKKELKEMLTNIDKVAINNNIIYHIELNLSCPNLIGKSIVAYDYECFNDYLKLIKNMKLSNILIGLKLPPYYNNKDFDKVCEIILSYGNLIKFVTCINSLANGLIIDYENESTVINPKNGYGGIGGIYCKPISLSNVNQWYRRFGDKISVIGCGGIQSGKDIFEYILAGAVAVQVGTQLIKEGTSMFSRLIKELHNCMEEKGYNKLTDFRGKLKVKPQLINPKEVRPEDY
jgi:dihydroorotate dehydrogenase (fumarate)